MLEGGPLELSRELEKFVKEDPQRFSLLITKFPDNTNVHYFNAVLMGIANSEKADLDSVLTVCRRCHKLPNRPCGRWITQPIANFAGEKLPKEALEIFDYYLINDPDPNEDLWNIHNSSGIKYFGGKIFESGINSARGMAAFSLSKLLFNDENLIQELLPTLDLFKELCETDDILLKTRQIELFLYYNLTNHFDEVSDIVYKMIFSDSLAVSVVGIRLISYSYLFKNGDLSTFNYCLNYSEFHRLGIAQVFSEYMAISPPSLINPVLISLFNDHSKEVRSIASSCFRKINDENINDYINLIDEFIFSPAFKENFNDLIYFLDNLEILPNITLDVCEKFFEITGSEASDIRSGSYATALPVASIIFKFYSQNMKELELKTRCLDLIDNMLIGDYGTTESILLEYEK
jgi:hypothetical protein